MTSTQKQIETQINQDYEKFYNDIYKSEIPTPENFIELFKKAIIALPSFAHKINFHKVQVIASKKVEQLTVGDVHEIVKVVLNVPLEKLYEGHTFDSAVLQTIKIEKFVLQYNKDVDDFREKLRMKKDNLLMLSGSRNGMKIIEA